MLLRILSSRMWSRSVRWLGIIVAVAFLGLSSCSNLTTYREDEFRDLDPTDYIRHVDPVNRPEAGQADRPTGSYFGVSEKAKEIDRRLGPGI